MPKKNTNEYETGLRKNWTIQTVGKGSVSSRQNSPFLSEFFAARLAFTWPSAISTSCPNKNISISGDSSYSCSVIYRCHLFNVISLLLLYSSTELWTQSIFFVLQETAITSKRSVLSLAMQLLVLLAPFTLDLCKPTASLEVFAVN